MLHLPSMSTVTHLILSRLGDLGYLVYLALRSGRVMRRWFPPCPSP